jgi:hypothetical protein
VASNLALLGAGGNYVLTNAGNQIGTLAANTGSISLVDAGNLNLGTVAGVSGISASGAFTVSSGGTITAPAGVNVGTFTLAGGNWVQNSATLPAFHATDFRIAGGSFLRATGGDGSAANPYSIADVYGLQGIGGSGLRTQNFILANDIDASGTAAWNSGVGFAPIANLGLAFLGTLNGAGHTIGNLTLASTGSNIPYVGLFGVIGAGGVVENLTLANITVTADPSTGSPGQFVGTVAGLNAGTISNVSVTGAVTGGAADIVGGLVGENSGTITQSASSAVVTGGDDSFVGGFAGLNVGGSILHSSATGAVTGGQGSFVGGLASLNLGGLIQDSYATGAVTGGDDSLGGGLVAVNLGTVSRSFASGAVTGGDGSHVGGLVAVNYAIPGLAGSGVISQAYATGAVTGGANSTVGGLIADNGGIVDQTYATGKLTGGPGSTIGGLIAVNSASFTIPTFTAAAGAAGAAALPTETGTVTFSYWDKQSTGVTTSAAGTSLTTAQLNSGLPAGFDPAVWKVLPGQSYPFLFGQGNDTIPPSPPSPTEPPPIQTQPPPQPIDVVLPNPTLQVVDNRTPDTNPTTPGDVVTPSGSSAPATTGSTSPSRPLRPDGRPSNVPPPGETRFVNNEVVFEICSDVPARRIQAEMRRLNLSLISSQSLGLIGCTIYHSHINSGRPVREVIVALERDRLIDMVAPNYMFALAQDASAPAPAAEGDPAQYAVAKLNLAEAHQIAKGDNVLIAVIDSEIDAKHPDLEGAIAARDDALGPVDKPHPHGTGMAGAMASHHKLVGTAPNARILAVRAFGGGANGGAQGTTVPIVQGLDWAVQQGAKIVNMSFAGPKDPTLEKAFKAAREKGVILIAAAGNAGPKSPPLYPGADPNVIAVSATDVDDQVFTGANRGKYVAVAAPGVDVLVPAPDGNYEFTTGTSVAAAEVSGIAALLVQRDPKLDSAGVREILTSTANNFGAKGRTDTLGYGVVDALRAVQAVDAKSASAPAPSVMAQRN